METIIFLLNLLQTREEKKLEAIVKAFERMEKREQYQRKKEALLEQSKKPKEKDKEFSGATKSEHDSSKSDKAASASQKITKQHSVVCDCLFLILTTTHMVILISCVVMFPTVFIWMKNV